MQITILNNVGSFEPTFLLRVQSPVAFAAVREARTPLLFIWPKSRRASLGRQVRRGKPAQILADFVVANLQFGCCRLPSNSTQKTWRAVEFGNFEFPPTAWPREYAVISNAVLSQSQTPAFEPDSN